MMRLIALGTCVMLAGCIASEEPEAPGAMAMPATVEAAPAPPPPPKPTRPTTFSYAGEMTQGGWIRGVAPGGTQSLTLGGAPVGVAPDGTFFAAFDRDAGPATTLSAKLADGRQVTNSLTISPRAWNIEHINAARRGGGPSASFMERRRPELARIGAARAKVTGAQGWKQDFIWPVKGRISGRFGSQRIYRGEPGSYHGGIDIATGGTGTPFVAPADGVVILAAETPFTLEGHLLMIDHGMGLNSAFLHCSALLVREGETVKQGQVIGRIGATGRATGPHLHWGLKWNKARLDPLLFTGPMN
jgi:murein DD-endopeptidase MepM/ murein hydrolase activator NlpD